MKKTIIDLFEDSVVKYGAKTFLLEKKHRAFEPTTYAETREQALETGAGLAASKGAVATVIRSIGTENHRTPHTGGTSFPKGVKATPAGGVSGIIRADMTASKSRAEPAAMLSSTPSLGVTTNS